MLFDEISGQVAYCSQCSWLSKYRLRLLPRYSTLDLVMLQQTARFLVIDVRRVSESTESSTHGPTQPELHIPSHTSICTSGKVLLSTVKAGSSSAQRSAGKSKRTSQSTESELSESFTL